MDRATWMSRRCAPLYDARTAGPALALLIAAALLLAMGCGGVALVAWSQALMAASQAAS